MALHVAVVRAREKAALVVAPRSGTSDYLESRPMPNTLLERPFVLTLACGSAKSMVQAVSGQPGRAGCNVIEPQQN